MCVFCCGKTCYLLWPIFSFIVICCFKTHVVSFCAIVLKTLKGQCHEIFDLYFFHESNPSGPLINRLKWFFLKICFRKASPLKIEQKMLVLVCIVNLWIRFCFTFPLKARRGLNRQNCSWKNSAQC